MPRRRRQPLSPFDVMSPQRTSAPPSLPSWMDPAAQWQRMLQPQRKAAPAQPAPVAPLTPEEESSLLGNIISAVQWTGETFDKPGAAVRGLASGMLGGEGPQVGLPALANLIPFSDTLGITEPEERVRGRELLEQAGIAGANQPGLFNSLEDFAGDVGGFAAEVATDPLFWATGPLGSFTKSGLAALKGAEKVGTTAADFAQTARQLKSVDPLVGQVMQTTPAAVAQQFRSGLRSPFGGRVPFTDISAALPVPGAVNRGIANVIDAVTYGKLSPIRAARGLFSHTTGGIYKGAIQRERDLRWAEKEVMKGRLLDAAPAFHARSNELIEGFRKIAEHHGKIGDPAAYQAFELEMRELAGQLKGPNQILDALKTRWNLPADASLEGISAETADLSQKMYEFLDVMFDSTKADGIRYKGLGGNLELLDDRYGDYFPRQLSKSLAQIMGKRREALGKGELPDIMQFWQGRRKYTKNYPGRAAGLNRIATNKAFMGVKEVDGELVRMTAVEQKAVLQTAMKEAGIAFDPKASRAALQKQYVFNHHIKPDLDNALADGYITREVYESELLRFTSAKHPENIALARSGKKAVDATDYLIQSYKHLPREMVQTGLFDRMAVEDFFTYKRAIAESESTLRTAHSMLKQPNVVGVGGVGVPLTKAWKDAGFRVEGLHTFAKEHFGSDKLAQENIGEFIRSLTVDEQASRALGAFGALTEPDKLNEIGAFVDKVNATYKGWLTIPFPAFHGRNRFSGFWQNLADGELGVTEYLKAEWDAHRYVMGNKDAMQFTDMFVELGGLRGQGMMVDIAGTAEDIALPSRGLREVFEPAVRAVRKPTLRDWNPFAMRGGFGQKVGEKATENIVAQIGDKTYNLVEFLNRATPFEALMRKGLTPAQAMYRVNRAQFVYGQLSPFEKTYMRRAIPFYNWIRRSIPYTLQRLFERPGGMVAQTIRLESQPTAEGGYTPAFMKEGLNVPWGGGTPEAASFIRQAGLPIEDLNRLVFTGKGGLNIGRTAEKIGAQFHPLLTMWPEMLANKQLYSGRKISDLESPTEIMFGTKVPAADKAIQYGPFSRAIGEGIRAIDPRKNWLQRILNTATGFKTGTYDLEKLRAIDLAKAQAEQLAADPLVREGVHYSVPQNKRALPEAQDAMQRLKTLRKLQQAVKKLREKRDRKKQISGKR